MQYEICPCCGKPKRPALLSERGLIMVSSPPYADQGLRPRTDQIDKIERIACGKLPKMGYSSQNPGYGQSPGQIGNLPEGKVIITSPPYENYHPWSMKLEALDEYEQKRAKELNFKAPTNSQCGFRGIYIDPNNSANIGNQNGESYWSAMRQVYAESLKIADVMVLVTKDPTRNKAIHPLGQMTADLITSIGWRIVDWHKAILYDTQEQGDLFGGSKKLYKGRVSFFKRLSLQKGSPAADHEDVIFAVNPNGRRSGIVEVTSPPYQTGTGEGQSLDPLKTTKGTVRGRGFTSLGPTYAQDIGATPGQIGNMPEGRVIISSPPYGNIETGPKGGSREFDNDRASKSHKERHGRHYSSNSANIGNLKE